MTVEAVILAGGLGKRMGGATPKARIEFCGAPLLRHVVSSARAVADRVHVVHGDPLTDWLDGHREDFGIDRLHRQEAPKGTADALACALPSLEDDARVLVLCVDTPLLTEETLRTVLAEQADLCLLVVPCGEDSRLGRILRDFSGQVAGIREYRDASEAERSISECNSGVLVARAGLLREWCAAITADNAQGELYLTDCVAQAVEQGRTVRSVCCRADEGLGINTPAEYAQASTVWQNRTRQRFMEQGVLLEAPDTVWASAGTEIAPAGVRIGPNVVFEGDVRIESGVRIHANVVLRDCTVGEGTEVHPFCVVQQARIGARCRIGPFARLRPEAELAEGVRIGNFVEIKKSTVGADTRINHLAYVGDSTVGRDVNIGAGSFTCNYDGADKHRTVIGDDVFIGSGVQMIAPVEVGDGATIGAGTTLSRDAPGDTLTVGRARAQARPGWKRPRKP